MAVSAQSPTPLAAPKPDQALDITNLYRLYAGQVGRWAARLAGPYVEIDDVVQDVFLVAKRRLTTFEPNGGQITTWLFRTTERIVKAARRKQRLRRLFGWSPRELAAVPDEGGEVPGRALERRQETKQVYAVLDHLPERLRRVLILFEIEGLSTAEIAALTGARVGTVRVWLFRARAAFLEHWERASAREPHDKEDRSR